MTAKEISEQLEAIAAADDFARSTAKLTEAWSAARVGFESVEPILRFMEQHPTLDYGMPGALVHFVEEFYTKGYKRYGAKLVESVGRSPTVMTVWMLNRLLNGTDEPGKRDILIRAMREAASNPKADQPTLDHIQLFLERL